MNSLTYFIKKIGFFFQLFLLLNAIPSHAQEKVTLQLKWTHAFQFAGYYAAKEQGYYKEAGLDVNILEAGPETDPVKEVIDNKAQYGVGSSGLLLSRSLGKPVVVLAVIFQQSPYEIYAAPEIHHLRDLVGKRLMLEPQSEELIVFLKKEGIPLDSIRQVQHSFTSDAIMQGQTDAMSGYLSSEPYYFRQANYPFQVFSPRSAGIDFYGDNLFTSEKEIANYPNRVKAFRAASLKGWQYAKNHPDKIIDLIYSKYSTLHPIDYLHFESEQMIPLLQPDLIDIGYMNLNLWQHIADTYSGIGLLPKGYSLEGFVYDANEKNMKWYFRILGLAVMIILFISIIPFYIYRVNQKLAKSISLLNQTKAALEESEELWHTIVRTSPDGIAITSLDGVFTQASDKMVQMLGYDSLNELLGKNIYEFVEPSYRSKAQLRRESVLNGEKLDPETFILIRKDGLQFWAESNVAVINDKYGKPRDLFFIERDINERIKAERKLIENEQSYFGLFNSVSEAIYIQDKNGIFIDVNLGVEKMYGYPRKELIGKSPDFLSAPEKNNIPEIIGLMEEIAKTGKPGRFEFWGKRRSGEIFPKEVIANKGKYFGKDVIITTARDITATKLAEISLKESRDQLSLVLQGSQLGFWDWNILTGEVKRNKIWAEMLGYSLEEIELSVKNLDTLVHQEDREKAWKSINDHLSGITSRHLCEYRMRCKDGQYKWISDKARIVAYSPEGKPIRMCGTHEDVTERIQMEEALRSSESTLKELFEANLDSISVCLFNPDGRPSNFIEFNEKAASFLGYTTDELRQLSPDKVEIKVPDDQMQMRISKLLANGNVNFETKLANKNGQLIDVEVKVAMIKYKSKPAIMNITRDITERKKAEEKLLENEALLKELNATKDKFFSIIAHDLKSPFNAIIGFSNLLSEQMKEKDYDGIEEYAEIIQNSSLRAMSLLSNLLEWSRSQTGRMDFQPEHFELVSLINEVTGLSNDFAQQKSITIVQELPHNLNVFADKAMIATILRNLLSNAIKFTNMGGRILVFSEQTLNEIIISIKDNGVGIDPEALGKLFRIDQNNSSKGTQNEMGTGLGLILCKEFIERHKGRIWAESEYGKGSSFSFALPNI